LLIIYPEQDQAGYEDGYRDWAYHPSQDDDIWPEQFSAAVWKTQDTKQFHLLLKFNQQWMQKASGSLTKTPANARV